MEMSRSLDVTLGCKFFKMTWSFVNWMNLRLELRLSSFWDGFEDAFVDLPQAPPPQETYKIDLSLMKILYKEDITICIML